MRYILFHSDGKVSSLFSNKRKLIRLAKAAGHHGDVRAVPNSYFHGYQPFGWDYATFRVCSTVVATI